MKKLLALLCITSLGYATVVEKVIKKTSNKVVKIGIIAKKVRESCSGSFVTPSGIILTCAHCFEAPDIQKVFIKTSNGRFFLAQPLLIDTKRDLALIAPQTYQGKFEYFKLGKEPKIGQQVISLGSPLGIQGTATVGYVDNLSEDRGTYVIHSAFISPGNSGGPLIDLKGRLIGVNEGTIQYGFLGLQQAQGLFIAIDLKTIKEIYHER